MKEIEGIRFDPHWNHIPRTVLIYTLPLGLLSLCLQQQWVELSRDFWVPFLWGLVVPLLNSRRSFGRHWALKDFQNRDSYPPTLAIVHGAVWCIFVNLAPSLPLAMVGFFGFFMAWDALLIRYDILCIYALDLHVHKGGTLKTLAYFGFLWWAYVSSGFALTHLFGSDTVVSIATSSLLMMVPMQLILLHAHLRKSPPQRFRDINNVAVVGAGWSGLYATKWMSECGLDVTCFEASDCIGGIWKYRENRPGGVFENTRVTSSKHFLHASDFPMKRSLSDFPDHWQILDYLNGYVDHFGIRGRIVLSTPVVRVSKKDHGWEVVTQEPSGAKQTRVFDAVVICSGPHQTPKLDVVEDLLYRNYDGIIIHAGDYKHGGSVGKDETILVVGAGETSADIVAECVQVGANVYWSSRAGQWFADRNIGPYPADHFTALGIRVLLGRFYNVEYLVRRFIIAVFINVAWGRGGHGIRGWSPVAPYLHQFLNKSRDAVLEVYRGRVQTRCAVTTIESKRVFFEGEQEPLVVDRIILATGYDPHWHFLDATPETLFKRVFDLEDPSLAFVGFARPVLGSIPSLSELQSRWVANVWSDRVSLPCLERREVMAYLEKRHDCRRIQDSSRLRVLVDQEVYATELASYVRAHVRWLKLLLTRPRAFMAVLWSPWIAFKYRLNDADPGVREEAVRNILREMPEYRNPGYGGNPAYIMAWELIFGGLLLAGLLILALWSLPFPTVVLIAAGLLFLTGVVLRLSEGSPVSQPIAATHRESPSDNPTVHEHAN